MDNKHGNSVQDTACGGEKPYTVIERYCGKRKKDIYGVAYIPRFSKDRNARSELFDGQPEIYPLAIFCHELYRTHTSGIPYAEELASHGIAVYTFDFRNGSKESRSGNDLTKNSVMTEAQDLSEVLDDAMEWDFVDSKKIVVIGASQGAFASAVVATRRPQDLAGLVLMYGAFVILDDAHRAFPNKESVPALFDYNGWSIMGAQYFTDVWDYDLDRDLGAYDQKVLVLHGDEDPLVDPGYSRRAAAAYRDAEFHIIRTGRHGFKKGAFTEAMQYIWQYLRKIGIMNSQ